MPRSIHDAEVVKLINEARLDRNRFHPSPIDWRDQWIYFILIDRFSNSQQEPNHSPWDQPYDKFQGGTFNGIRDHLDYLKEMGVGAIWLSPVLKNAQYKEASYHGYGIQDFLAIEPRFSSDPERARQDPTFAENELRQLVDAIHQHGMYIIFDIILNHVGSVFSYRTDAGNAEDVPWREEGKYDILWHDEKGRVEQEWSEPPTQGGKNEELTSKISQDALIWPQELQRNDYFRRQGNAFTRAQEDGERAGDFNSLKELVTDYVEYDPFYGRYYPVRQALIVAHQYLLAKYDIDGFRIDTLKYLEPDFVRSFGTAISEFATVIGKKNFFTFGEVFDDDEKISHFVGRDVHNHGDLLGVDAALDFPLFFVLPGVIKGQKAPSDLVAMYENRQHTLAPIISAQGEIGSFFVNFLDNHDVNSRFYSAESDDPRKYDAHMSLALTCLLTLQGIPSLYYGTEQGLQGSGESSEATREALWGKPNAFDLHHPFYRTIELLSRLRARQPAIRYGRQYFRQTSEDGVNFSYATRPGGVLAYSRLLDSQEVVVIANTSLDQGWQGETLIDYAIEANNHAYTLQYSNQRVVQNSYPISMIDKNEGTIQITNLDGTNSKGATRAIRVELLPAEVQVWSKGR